MRGGGKEMPTLKVKRWHYAANGLRPLAKERVGISGADLDPAAVESEWLPLVADQIGTPCALFGADGEQRWHADLTLWGRARASREVLRAREGTTADASCALRFPGHWEDAERWLHYNFNCYYDPETGQHLSPDPIGLDGGQRSHGYVHDPVH